MLIKFIMRHHKNPLKVHNGKGQNNDKAQDRNTQRVASGEA